MKSLKITAALFLSLLLFASCGGNNETETDQPESGTESRETVPDTESDTMEETDPITDAPMTDDEAAARSKRLRATAKKQAEAMVDKVRSALDLYLR